MVSQVSLCPGQLVSWMSCFRDDRYPFIPSALVGESRLCAIDCALACPGGQPAIHDHGLTCHIGRCVTAQPKDSLRSLFRLTYATSWHLRCISSECFLHL
jgi:hypothetical protein